MEKKKSAYKYVWLRRRGEQQRNNRQISLQLQMRCDMSVLPLKHKETPIFSERESEGERRKGKIFEGKKKKNPKNNTPSVSE